MKSLCRPGAVSVVVFLRPSGAWLFRAFHPRLALWALFLRRFAAWRTLALFHMSARGSPLSGRSSSTGVDLRWVFAAQCARHLYS